MHDWASSGRVKIEWAKEHIRQLDSEAEAFFKADGYRLTLKYDPQTDEFVGRVEGGPIPPFWAARAADAIHNLRTALDILWRQVMHPTGHATARKLYFPIFKSAHELEARAAGIQEGSRKRAMHLLSMIKPYEGGNDALLNLVALDSRNKHEMLTLVCCVFRSLSFTTPAPTATLQYTFTPDSSFYIVENGTELFRAKTPFAKMEVQPKLTFEVSFGKGEIAEGEPVVPTLHQYAGLVDGIAQAFLTAGLIR